jgi:gluconokinase
MGVSGTGKSTVARAIATALDLDLAEGDDFHPLSNVAKMSEGMPLSDEDRRPWLECLAEWMHDRAHSGRSTIVTCSALRRRYRDVLRTADPETFFIHLRGSEEVIAERMQAREHFMPASLLRSQLETLEPLEPDERGVTLDISGSADDVVREALAAVQEPT